MRSLAAAALGILLCACGGGGSPYAVQPAATFRSNGPGDSWNYNVSITFTGYGANFGTYTGTLTEAMTSDTYDNQDTVRFSQTFNLNLQQGPANISSYSEIGLNGQLLAEVDNGQLVAVTSNTFQPPSTLGPGVSAKGTVTLADGTSLAETYTVVGAEDVVTDAGVFRCWKVDQTVAHSDGTSDAFTAWVAPETGNYVKLSDTTTNPDSTAYTYTVSLTSMVAATSGSIRLSWPGLPLVLPARVRG